jgi:hypothetical protein
MAKRSNRAAATAAAPAPATAATNNSPVLVFNPPAKWVGVKATALANTGSNRGKWLNAMQQLAGQPQAAVIATLAANMPAQAKAGSKHAYTVGMWLGWAAKVNIISWQ